MMTSTQARKVYYYKLGLRVGSDTSGAAYALSDFGFNDLMGLEQLKAVAQWALDSNDNTRAGWDNKLKYTVYYLLGQIKINTAKLSLVDGAPVGGESYKMLGEKNTSFAKCNRVTGGIRAMTDAPNVSTNDDRVVDDLFNWVMNQIDNLPDPGDDWWRGRSEPSSNITTSSVNVNSSPTIPTPTVPSHMIQALLQDIVTMSQYRQTYQKVDRVRGCIENLHGVLLELKAGTIPLFNARQIIYSEVEDVGRWSQTLPVLVQDVVNRWINLT